MERERERERETLSFKSVKFKLPVVLCWPSVGWVKAGDAAEATGMSLTLVRYVFH